MLEAGSMVVGRFSLWPASRADITKVDLAPGLPGYRERLTSYLRRVLADPVVREAVAVSSASLADTLDRFLGGARVDLAKLERAAFAVTRYVLRLCSRPTPFGVLAGVTAGTFGPGATIRVGTRHRKVAHPDAEWLSALVNMLERRPGVLAASMVVANNLCAVRGDRLELGYVHGVGSRSVAEVSVRHTPVVSAVLAAARHPIAYADLRDALRTEFPTGTESTVDTLLATLIDKQFLLSDCHPGPFDTDPIGYLRGRNPTDDTLAGVGSAIDTYADTPVGGGMGELRTATATMQAVGVSSPPAIRVDLVIDVDFQLPEGVAQEVKGVATALCRMSRESVHLTHLRHYHAAFVERYGLHQVVPLLELLDAHRGLDAPARYRLPARSHAAVVDDREYDDLIAELAWDAGDELVLDDALIQRIGGPERPPPPAIELCVRLFADSTDALDRGEFTMAVSPVVGATRPGPMTGRFARLLGLDRTLAEAACQAAEGLPVQVVSRTATARAANVTSVPRLVEHIVPVGTFADGRDPSVIGLDDIEVGATPDRLYLVSRRLGRLLTPVVPHALDPTREMPNAARLLVEIASMRSGPMYGWDWGRLGHLPRLPRVRYGRTILAPARWRPPSTLATATEPWPDWCQRLATWRAESAVPARVDIALADNQITLDLGVDLHRQILRHELRRRRHDVVVLESLAGTAWTGGHAVEFVVPLTRPVEPPSRRTAVPPRHVAARQSEWLYAKLYAIDTTHDALLTDELPRLLADLPEGIDRWFFVRYRDPDPHLRVRFHGDPRCVAGELLPMLHDWSTEARRRGMIRTVTLDGYEPETSRYGGPTAIAAAERLFCADSELVIAQLQRRGGGSPIEVLAAMNFVAILQAIGDRDWSHWATAKIPATPPGVDRRRLRSGRLDLVSDLSGGTDPLASWAHRTETAAAFGHVLRAAADTEDAIDTAISGVLHMYANRLLGTDHRAEQTALGIVRAHARSTIARRTSPRPVGALFPLSYS